MSKIRGDHLVSQAFQNLMQKYPYVRLPHGTSYEIRKNMYLIKGRLGFYPNPMHTIVVGQVSNPFILAMDYQIYLLTNCVIQVGFQEIVQQIKVKKS